MLQKLFIIFSLIYISSCYRSSDDPIVTIKNGQIMGRNDVTKLYKKPYEAFQGIPFAQPPVGDLRFEAPKSVEDWTGILNATSDEHFCVQLDFGDMYSVKYNEDCLYLSVYTPSTKLKNLPVIVWIYGGIFLFGSLSYDLYSPDYFLENDIVFVSFNYRLGIFGFYSTEDEIAPGNAGLKDQLMVLNWVKENIANFGGNPQDITLFGQSAGAASISYLMMAPQTEGLFQKVILHSGSALNPWALARGKRENTFQTGRLLGIETNDSKILLEELRKKTTYEIMFSSMITGTGGTFADNPLDGMLFAPSVEPNHEDAVITGKTHEKLKNGEFHFVPLLTGHTGQESEVLEKVMGILKLYLTKFQSDISTIVPINMNIEDIETKTEVGEKIAEFYEMQNLIFANDTNILQFISDNVFVKCNHKLAVLHSKYAPVYTFVFNYHGDISPDLGQTGFGHGDDLTFIFATNLTKTDRDSLMRDRLVKMWTNFVKFGNPTPQNDDNLLQNITWKQFSEQDENFLEIGDNLITSINPDKVAVEFWDKLYENYGIEPFDTY